MLPDPAIRRPARGFTLLEVMIALAILAVSLVAIIGINSGAMNMHAYAKRLTLATMLARSKMADVEQQLQAEGLPSDDKIEDGNFDDEGYPEYLWKAEIIRPKTEDIAVGNLLSMFGGGLGGADGKSGANSQLSSLASAAGLDPAALTGMAGGAGGGAAAGMAGMLGGAMQSQLQGMLDQLGKTMREVRLTVSWKSGKQVDQFTIVTHVVSLGQGTDQLQSDQVAQGDAAAQAGNPPPGWPSNIPWPPAGGMSGAPPPGWPPNLPWPPSGLGPGALPGGLGNKPINLPPWMGGGRGGGSMLRGPGQINIPGLGGRKQ